MILGITVPVALVVTTCVLFYEVLRLTSAHLADLPVPPRARIVVVVLAAFVGHVLAVALYALAYWTLNHWRLGAIAGSADPGFIDFVYFSVVSYTTLGFGDQVPTGQARLLAGVQALNGLLLIAWTASFTYLAMERYWPLHPPSRRRPR